MKKGDFSQYALRKLPSDMYLSNAGHSLTKEAVRGVVNFTKKLENKFFDLTFPGKGDILCKRLLEREQGETKCQDVVIRLFKTSRKGSIKRRTIRAVPTTALPCQEMVNMLKGKEGKEMQELLEITEEDNSVAEANLES